MSFLNVHCLTGMYNKNIKYAIQKLICTNYFYTNKI